MKIRDEKAAPSATAHLADLHQVALHLWKSLSREAHQALALYTFRKHIKIQLQELGFKSPLRFYDRMLSIAAFFVLLLLTVVLLHS